jgi:c-di-GMP-binding flagellar brake protein YcgR
MYKPLFDSKKLSLWGRVKDISRSGMRLEVPTANTLKCSHEPDNDFAASAFLPTGKRLDVSAKIVKCDKSSAKGTAELGVKFVNLNEHANQVLGFFLMP